MALYAIGDVQGCDMELGALLDKLNFSADRDRLWCVGDLVNRGRQSLNVLRRLRSLGSAATVTLGNHDLHLLAIAHGSARLHKDDTLAEILAAPDREILLDWLLHRPLMHEDGELNVCMLHAGLAPEWDIATARGCAREFESALRRDPRNLFDTLYGDEPDRWNPGLQGTGRLRFIGNCFTRLRYVDGQNRLALRAKGNPKKADRSLTPWFNAPGARWRGTKIVFGHWSTLGFFRNVDVIGLDTGCVWGGSLTALRIDDPNADPVQMPCVQTRPPR